MDPFEDAPPGHGSMGRCFDQAAETFWIGGLATTSVEGQLQAADEYGPVSTEPVSCSVLIGAGLSGGLEGVLTAGGVREHPEGSTRNGMPLEAGERAAPGCLIVGGKCGHLVGVWKH